MRVTAEDRVVPHAVQQVPVGDPLCMEQGIYVSPGLAPWTVSDMCSRQLLSDGASSESWGRVELCRALSPHAGGGAPVPGLVHVITLSGSGLESHLHVKRF